MRRLCTDSSLICRREICTEGGSKRCGELPAAGDELAAIIIGVTARRAATRDVTVQKSAAAIVVFRYFTRVAEHEGPNMRSRTEQWCPSGKAA